MILVLKHMKAMLSFKYINAIRLRYSLANHARSLSLRYHYVRQSNCTHYVHSVHYVHCALRLQSTALIV